MNIIYTTDVPSVSIVNAESHSRTWPRKVSPRQERNRWVISPRNTSPPRKSPRIITSSNRLLSRNIITIVLLRRNWNTEKIYITTRNWKRNNTVLVPQNWNLTMNWKTTTNMKLHTNWRELYTTTNWNTIPKQNWRNTTMNELKHTHTMKTYKLKNQRIENEKLQWTKQTKLKNKQNWKTNEMKTKERIKQEIPKEELKEEKGCTGNECHLRRPWMNRNVYSTPRNKNDIGRRKKKRRRVSGFVSGLPHY